MQKINFSIANDGRKKLLVCSHERSGTHFLMNTVSNHFGYVSTPWWNFDIDSLTINFHCQQDMELYFRQYQNKPVLNILKSHHPAVFFDKILDYLCDQFHVLYIYRDPRDVIVSNWKLIQSFSWDEGPRTETASAFLRSEPSSAMLRYQKQQERNMLQRWKTHVGSWVRAAESNPSLPVCLLRYEDLNSDFEKSLMKIQSFTGIDCGEIQKPKVDENVIGKGQGKSGGYKDHFDSDDLEFVRQEAGDLMMSLGYSV